MMDHTDEQLFKTIWQNYSEFGFKIEPELFVFFLKKESVTRISNSSYWIWIVPSQSKEK